MCKADQEYLEMKYSKQNIIHFLKYAIEQELDNELSDWALKFSLRVSAYLEQEYSYDSKNARVSVLAAELTLDNMLIAVLSAVLYKQTPETVNFQEVVGRVAAKMPHESVWDRIKCAAELLYLGSGLGIYSLHKPGNGRMHEVIRHWQLDSEVYGWINETGFNLPMLCKPRKVDSNRNCGYLAIQEPLVLGGRLKQHDQQQAYDVINIQNSIEWEIDMDVLGEPEVPSKPLDTPEKLQQFKQQIRDSQVMYNLMLEYGNRFWMCNQYDCRGRLYQHGYNIHFQSYTWKKALLNFKQKELVTGV